MSHSLTACIIIMVTWFFNQMFCLRFRHGTQTIHNSKICHYKTDYAQRIVVAIKQIVHNMVHSHPPTIPFVSLHAMYTDLTCYYSIGDKC